MTQTSSQHTQHYLVLDGLRGVAALLVLVYHLFEAIAFADGREEQDMFHGFLAVDFFLILSGFVMSYAYDRRWPSMSLASFFRRRLTRLHPMVVAGVVLGIAVFIGQGCMRWDGTPMSTATVVVDSLMALLLLPVPQSLDLRGNTELFPLNGPHWSLFFEYLFNILYALLLRRFSTRALTVWVICVAALLLMFTTHEAQATIGFGWSSTPSILLGGLLRVAFDYPMGLLLARWFHTHDRRPIHTPWLFPILATVLLLLLSIPSLRLANAYYEMVCIAVAFPIIVWCGARSDTPARKNAAVMTLFGDISYPLYAIHYPLIYLYIGWINAGVRPFGPYEWCTPVALGLIAVSIAYLLSRFYDKPLRRWMAQRR